MDQATVKKYSDKFAELRQTKYFVFNTENKYWYKDQFKWRLTFRGRDISRYENFLQYKSMKITFKAIDKHCRTRNEHTLSVFTNSTDLLDFVFHDPDYRNMLIQVTHVDTQYEAELANLDGVAFDVKFQGPRSYDPKYKYQVDFAHDFGYSQNGGDWRNKRIQKVKELNNYVNEHSDVLYTNIYITDSDRYFYHGPIKVWVADEMHIPLLYVMFGQINKIWKLVKKEKNNEQQFSTSTN